MNYAMPTQVTGRIHSEMQQGPAAPPVPMAFSGMLTFAGGACASFYCFFTAANAQSAMVSGDQGLLQILDFVLPFSGAKTKFSLTRSEFIINGCQFDMHEGCESKLLDEPSNNAEGSQKSEMFHAFSKLAMSGKIESHWPQTTLQTQRVLDACLLSAQSGSLAVFLS